MNYVVVGGGGFIGSNLSEALLYNQNQVVVVDHPNALFLKKLYNLGASIITGDFCDEETLKKALSKALRDSLDLFHRVVNDLLVTVEKLERMGISTS